MLIKVQTINKREKRKLQMYFAKATLGLQTRASEIKPIMRIMFQKTNKRCYIEQ